MSSHDPVLTEDEDLLRRLADLGVQASDLEESFVRSGGRGGQHVNKTATCVVLLHRPSGIQIKCQTTRHQGLNRQLARRILVKKLEDRRSQQLAEERCRLARLRRQSRKRSRGAKERMLENKARHASKKSMRRRVDPE